MEGKLVFNDTVNDLNGGSTSLRKKSRVFIWTSSFTSSVDVKYFLRTNSTNFRFSAVFKRFSSLFLRFLVNTHRVRVSALHGFACILVVNVFQLSVGRGFGAVCVLEAVGERTVMLDDILLSDVLDVAVLAVVDRLQFLLLLLDLLSLGDCHGNECTH